jgi:hypothetical protein
LLDIRRNALAHIGKHMVATGSAQSGQISLGVALVFANQSGGEGDVLNQLLAHQLI